MLGQLLFRSEVTLFSRPLCASQSSAHTGCPYSLSEPPMAAALQWDAGDDEPVPASFPSSQHRVRCRRTPVRPGELPPDIAAAIWRGTELGSPVTTVLSSGFPALDAELPDA